MSAFHKFFATLLLITISISQSACTKRQAQSSMFQDKKSVRFYSDAGHEVDVTFKALYLTSYTSLEEVKSLTYQKTTIADYQIPETLQYLFGPLTYHEMGGPKKDFHVNVLWEQAQLNASGYVVLPYQYTGTWLLDEHIKDSFTMPLPLNEDVVFTEQWKACGDSAPDHQTRSFFWYFWEPTRVGCDQKLDQQYQNITVSVLKETTETTETFPEYNKLLSSAGKDKNLQMTFAFGYVEDPAKPNPDKDNDTGMFEYRRFVSYVRKNVASLNFTETPILESEYLNPVRPKQKIGTRFSGIKDGVQITVNIVAAADIDQMQLFAQSFSHNQDGFFGWFGHSRVGSGFDADQFRYMTQRNPEYYPSTTHYQMIYWGGCNSYSYYTLPFFKFKANLDIAADPLGTKSLDIISNGLPSLFIFNSVNASIAFDALLNWEQKTSYQQIVHKIEDHAKSYGQLVLVNILGDEDNQD